MCFSPEADLLGGVLVGAIGVDVLVHLRGRRRYRPLAALPLMFGAHQIVESVVWWSARGSLPETPGTIATWTYLLFALVVLPSYVPWATWRIEPPGARRRLMAWLSGVGALVSLSLLAAMLIGPVQVRAAEWHLAYSISLRADAVVIAVYVLATCGAFVLSGERLIVWFGVVNLLAVVLIAVLLVDGFASVWCAWAAVTSAAFAAYLRREDPELFRDPAPLESAVGEVRSSPRRAQERLS